MENLTKENFFNELYAKYPEKVQVFCNWIDKYKAENNWDRLFAPKDVPQSVRDEVDEMWLAPESPTTKQLEEIQKKEWEIIKKAKSVKFHDLPLAMQIGILTQFIHENHPEMITTDFRALSIESLTEAILEIPTP